jgi:hypothetical protein
MEEIHNLHSSPITIRIIKSGMGEGECNGLELPEIGMFQFILIYTKFGDGGDERMAVICALG